jgi:Dullard-like phosphatase family protein
MGAAGEPPDLAAIGDKTIGQEGTTTDRPRCSCRDWLRWCCAIYDEYPYAEHQVLVPAGAKLLVLDLDETLVHCSFQEPEHFEFQFQMPYDGTFLVAYIQKRPHVDKFLAAVVQSFLVVIFTASMRDYANPVIDIICPSIPADRRLFRDACLLHEGFLVKDLRIFNRPLEDIIIVDNNPASFLFHPRNGIVCRTWEGSLDDTELLRGVLPLLERCRTAADVRTVISGAPGHCHSDR